MNKFPFRTALALLFIVLSAASVFFNAPLFISLPLCLAAFFLTISDVPKFTSWFQFIVAFSAACMLGLEIEVADGSRVYPFLTLSMAVAAAASLCRIAFFRFFAYTRFRYFELIAATVAALLYFVANFSNDYAWNGWIFPLPVLLFSFYFGWGILKDQSQLLSSVRGGYKVQVGQPADDFSLPDEKGEIVKLSDFRNTRHVLLIFVRGDWCPGCHMMLRTYEKNREKFSAKNVVVLAIGPDTVGVNREMVSKLGLDFRILSDEGQKTAMIYGVQLKEYENVVAENYKEGIPLPASFLIDKAGIVRYVSRPDRIGEFLNPSLIFPIVEQLA